MRKSSLQGTALSTLAAGVFLARHKAAKGDSC